MLLKILNQFVYDIVVHNASVCRPLTSPNRPDPIRSARWPTHLSTRLYPRRRSMPAWACAPLGLRAGPGLSPARTSLHPLSPGKVLTNPTRRMPGLFFKEGDTLWAISNYMIFSFFHVPGLWYFTIPSFENMISSFRYSYFFLAFFFLCNHMLINRITICNPDTVSSFCYTLFAWSHVPNFPVESKF